MADSRVPMTIRDFFFEDPFFKTSWEDFDRVREAMFQESRDMWKKFDEDFRQMACMSNNIMLEKQKEVKEEAAAAAKSQEGENRSLQRQDSLARWENSWMFPRRWMLPSLKSELGSLDLFKAKDSEVIRMKEDKDKMEVSLDTAQYRPDELKVSVVNDVICVEGKHEEKAEDGSRMVSRQFVRKYTLPQGAKPEDVTSNLSSDGVLVITAKKANPAIEVKIDQK
jgi:HSP20 family molecular chaperone IbpA